MHVRFTTYKAGEGQSSRMKANNEDTAVNQSMLTRENKFVLSRSRCQFIAGPVSNLCRWRLKLAV